MPVTLEEIKAIFQSITDRTNGNVLYDVEIIPPTGSYSECHTFIITRKIISPNSSRAIYRITANLSYVTQEDFTKLIYEVETKTLDFQNLKESTANALKNKYNEGAKKIMSNKIIEKINKKYNIKEIMKEYGNKEALYKYEEGLYEDEAISTYDYERIPPKSERKLRAKWTPEMAKDLENSYSPNKVIEKINNKFNEREATKKALEEFAKRQREESDRFSPKITKNYLESLSIMELKLLISSGRITQEELSNILCGVTTETTFNEKPSEPKPNEDPHKFDPPKRKIDLSED